MKTLIFLSSLVSLSLAIDLIDVNSLNITHLKFDLDKDFVEEFLISTRSGRGDEDLTAKVNEFADRLFKKVQAFAVKNHIDPLDISDVKERFAGVTIQLKNGQLHGIGTIERSDEDVLLIYNSDRNVMEIQVPFIFSNVEFDFKLHTKNLLIGVNGNMVGTIKDLKMKIKLDFDLNSHHAEVKEVATVKSGKVNLKFSGHGIVRKVVNVLTKFVVKILHPKINTMIKKIVDNVAENVATTVNKAIDGFFNQKITASVI